jgi:serine/threonine protein kinase
MSQTSLFASGLVQVAVERSFIAVSSMVRGHNLLLLSTILNALSGWGCAMKQLNSESKTDLESFEREMELLYQLPSHPNIVRCKYHQSMSFWT